MGNMTGAENDDQNNKDGINTMWIFVVAGEDIGSQKMVTRKSKKKFIIVLI